MASWLQRPRAYAHLPQWLVQKVPGLAAAPEYKALGSADLQLPGVVGGAFAQFLSRLQQDTLTGPRSDEDAARLSAAYHVLEWLATSHDPDVINVVVVEIFENLDCESHVLEAIETHLGKASGQLYDTWLG
jgi:hypothetical protein